MRKALVIALMFAAPAALAQGSTPDWEFALAKKYAVGGHVAIGDTLYAFGTGSQLAHQASGKYVFVRCGGIAGMKSLVPTDSADATTLQSLQLVTRNDPAYAAIHARYNNECWHVDAVKDAWGKLIKKAESIGH